MTQREIRILVTGGGTGGHVSPPWPSSRNCGELAAERRLEARLSLCRQRAGRREGLAQEAGVEFVGVQSGKLRRARSLAGLLSRRNLADALRVPVGIGQAMRDVRRFRPDVVFATGGYVSVPPVVAAGCCRYRF